MTFLRLLSLLAALTTVNAAPVRIVLAGDSTVAEEGGWGPGFRQGLSSRFEVINLAKNGRSSKSFRDEGLWAGVLAANPQYALIQFGHNDVPGKGPDRETDPKTTYRANLERYVDEVRATGATPILVTSIVRRNLTADGKVQIDSLAPYVEAVRALAAERHIALIDLYALTMKQCNDLGPDECHALGAVTAEGKPDNTHLGPKGKRDIGAIAAREFLRLIGRK